MENIVFALQFVHRRKKIFQISKVVIQISLKHRLNHETITHDLIKEADTNKSLDVVFDLNAQACF